MHVTAHLVTARRRAAPIASAVALRRMPERPFASAVDSRRMPEPPFASVVDIHRALERPLALALARADFRIVHLAVRPTRLELLVEADDRIALARGMQGFQVSAARSLNRLRRRRGRVFVDRYHARILHSRSAVAAVLARLPQHAQRRLAIPLSRLFDP